MKVGLVCSHGGHMTELVQILPAFENADLFYITYDSIPTRQLEHAYLMKNIGTNPFRMLLAFWTILRVLLKERPDLLVSTGAEVAIPAFYLAWLLRTARLLDVRTVFIESWTRVTMPTQTGKLVYPISDVFLVQWQQMLPNYGPKARYGGIIL